MKYDTLTHYFKSEERIPISFNDFNRPLGFTRKTKDGSIGPKNAKEDQEKSRSNLSEITRKKWGHKSEEQKIQEIILKCMTKQGKNLKNRLMFILRFYLRLNIKQNMEKDSKY